MESNFAKSLSSGFHRTAYIDITRQSQRLKSVQERKNPLRIAISYVAMSTNGANGDQPPVAAEKINTDIVTLTRFLTEEQSKHKEATGDFTYARSISFRPSHAE